MQQRTCQETRALQLALGARYVLALQPIMIELDVENNCGVFVQYACGSILHSDVKRVPAVCDICNAPAVYVDEADKACTGFVLDEEPEDAQFHAIFTALGKK